MTSQLWPEEQLRRRPEAKVPCPALLRRAVQESARVLDHPRTSYPRVTGSPQSRWSARRFRLANRHRHGRGRSSGRLRDRASVQQSTISLDFRGTGRSAHPRRRDRDARGLAIEVMDCAETRDRRQIPGHPTWKLAEVEAIEPSSNRGRTMTHPTVVDRCAP